MRFAGAILIAILVVQSLGTGFASTKPRETLTVAFTEPRDCAEARQVVREIDVVVTCRGLRSRYYMMRVTDPRRFKKIVTKIGTLREVRSVKESRPIPIAK